MAEKKRAPKKAVTKRAPKSCDEKSIVRSEPVPIDVELVSSLVLNGDISKMTPDQRTKYYLQICKSLSLNPYTQPFAVLTLSEKTVLYAQKGATDQLRKVHGVSVETVTQTIINDICVTTATVRDKQGRTDSATGAVSIAGLKGDNMANAIMKSETKAKRRATLSICGLGMLDESELETIPGAATAKIIINGTTPPASPPETADADKRAAEAAAKIKALPDNIKKGFELLDYKSRAVWEFCNSRDWDNDRIYADINKIVDRQTK